MQQRKCCHGRQVWSLVGTFHVLRLVRTRNSNRPHRKEISCNSAKTDSRWNPKLPRRLRATMCVLQSLVNLSRDDGHSHQRWHIYKAARPWSEGVRSFRRVINSDISTRKCIHVGVWHDSRQGRKVGVGVEDAGRREHAISLPQGAKNATRDLFHPAAGSLRQLLALYSQSSGKLTRSVFQTEVGRCGDAWASLDETCCRL